MLKSKYILICFLLLFIPSLAFGLNIDADSNDMVDVAYGGSNVGTFALNGVLFGNGTSAIGVTAIGAAGTMLQVGADPFVPAWSAYTFPATVPTVGKVLISDGTNLIGSTALGTAAYVTATDYLAVADIDDTPVDAETAQPISSNYMYDHITDADQHPEYALETIVGTSLGIGLTNDGGVLKVMSAETSLTDSDAPAPDLDGGGSYFQFTDDATTDVDTIEGFSNFPVDTLVQFRFEDAYWKIDFSGTNLYGHGGLDWEPPAGSSMICQSHDGTKIECIVSHPSALAISKYYNIPLDSTPDSDDSWHGMTVELENASAVEPIPQWALVYVRTDGAGQEGGIWPWDADLATYKSYKPIGVVIEAGGIAVDATGTVAIGTGIARNAGWAFTDNTDEGKTVYGTTTAGVMSVTAPAVAGDIVCAVGTVLDDGVVLFNFGLCSSVEVP